MLTEQAIYSNLPQRNELPLGSCPHETQLFSQRNPLFALEAWVKGGTGKGKLLSDIHPAGSSYTGDKVFLCCGTKGDWWPEPSAVTAPFPSLLSYTGVVRELPVPWHIAQSSELCLSLLMDTQDQAGLLFPRFLKPCMFNYGLLANINPSAPKEDYSSLKEHRDKPGGRVYCLSPTSPSEHPKPEQHVHTLYSHFIPFQE